MRADSALDVLLCPSPNHGPRDARLSINTLILHYTGMPEADGALKWLCVSESEVSAHYFIYEDGRIVQMVPEARRAWHAGAAFWAGESDINGCSIGIEIANEGPEGENPEFPEVQMQSVIALCRDILSRHDIPPKRVLAHSDVAPGRKADPGPYFDWELLAQNGIGCWPTPAELPPCAALRRGDEGEAVAAYQQALASYGYKLEVTGRFCEATETVTRAFQLHFRPARIDGVADRKTQHLLRGLCEII